MSERKSDTAKTTRLECIVPILTSTHLQTSIEYYEKVLGFKRDWGGDDLVEAMASVSRDGVSVMLCQGSQGHSGTWIWIGVEDVETLYEEYKASGATILQPPTNYYWALEMRISDPDSHVLRFGSDPKKDVPFVT